MPRTNLRIRNAHCNGLALALLLAFVASSPAGAAGTDAATGGKAITAETLLTRHRAASGAAASLAAIDSLSMRGNAEAGDMRFTVHERRKRPGKIRTEFVIDGQTIVQASDGSDAWWQDPVMGSGKVEAMPDAYGQGFRRMADLDDFYLPPDHPDVTFTYLGKHEEADGRVLHEVQVGYADGASHSRFFDQESGLYVRKKTSGPNGEVIADFSDFRAVGGVLIAFRVELSLDQRFIYHEAMVNEVMLDTLFERPKE